MSPCILVEEKHSPKSLPASIHATTTPTTTDETRRNMKDEEQTEKICGKKLGTTVFHPSHSIHPNETTIKKHDCSPRPVCSPR